MRDCNYTILDCFDQKLDDFDIVAISITAGGSNECAVGVYYRTCVLTWDDFGNRDKRTTVVALKRYNLFNTGMYHGVADRQSIELGALPGTYQLKGVVKIDSPSEDMMFLRANILDAVKNGRISNSVTRKYMNELLQDAEAQGRLY